MSAARDELLRILNAVVDDLERDGYSAEQIAAAMVAIGADHLFCEGKHLALALLDAVRRSVAKQDDDEWEWLQ